MYGQFVDVRGYVSTSSVCGERGLERREQGRGEGGNGLGFKSGAGDEARMGGGDFDADPGRGVSRSNQGEKMDDACSSQFFSSYKLSVASAGEGEGGRSMEMRRMGDGAETYDSHFQSFSRPSMHFWDLFGCVRIRLGTATSSLTA